MNSQARILSLPWRHGDPGRILLPPGCTHVLGSNVVTQQDVPGRHLRFTAAGVPVRRTGPRSVVARVLVHARLGASLGRRPLLRVVEVGSTRGGRVAGRKLLPDYPARHTRTGRTLVVFRARVPHWGSWLLGSSVPDGPRTGSRWRSFFAPHNA
jgi:hypothetical protein